METVSKKAGLVLGILLSLAAITWVFAAEGDTPAPAAPPAEPQQNARGGGGQRGFAMNPQEMQQRMMERFKTQLSATDDEWKVIEPKLSKVMTLSRNIGASRMMGFGGRNRGSDGGRRGQDSEEQPSAVQAAATDLQQTLEKPDVATGDIKAKLSTYRAAREKAKQELLQSQEELRSVLTLRQEAQLVIMGVLD